MQTKNKDNQNRSMGRAPVRDGKRRAIRTNGVVEVATMRMAVSVLKGIMSTVGNHPPETGCLLLGPIGTADITDFYYDRKGSCTAASYSPDHQTLNAKLKDYWLPFGTDWKGFCHSHPRGIDRLSIGDLVYIERLLKSNSDMEVFAAPIVLPDEYRMCPFVVSLEPQLLVRPARLMIF